MIVKARRAKPRFRTEIPDAETIAPPCLQQQQRGIEDFVTGNVTAAGHGAILPRCGRAGRGK
jgi:hypothetical protein